MPAGAAKAVSGHGFFMLFDAGIFSYGMEMRKEWLTAAMIAVRKEVSKGRGSVINARFGSVTDAEWPDSCLGIDTGELCAQVITPGYEIEVFYLDTPYTYRTNQDGTVVLLAN